MPKASLSAAQKKSRNFAVHAARLLHDRKCDDIRILDVRSLSQVCDFLVLGSGTSHRQMRSVAHELKTLGKEMDNQLFRTNADEVHTWIVVDFVDVVVHIFEPNQRAYYDLESLWADAAVVPWKRVAKPSRLNSRPANKE